MSLAEHRRSRAAHRQRRVVFSFDLGDPATYLAAERVDRLDAAVAWQPVIAPALVRTTRAEADRRAAELRLPLVWAGERPVSFPRAQRAAAFAAEHGRGGPFVLAASRLAFCGGFDLDDPEILAEAAAASSVPLEPCLAAAADAGRDAELERCGRFLAAHGADALPVLQVGRVLFAGERRLSDAAAALRDGAARAVRTPAFR
ncbi:MAG TPA: hypothetical protein VFR97_11435 [Capillimicrobium sp.]|nr:hypothetical protein [Capillimicrobium sp.]